MPGKTAIERLRAWAEPAPEIGPAVYRLTRGPKEHKHTYHIYCPWSPDGEKLLLLRYDKADPAAEVCVMNPVGGGIRPVAVTRNWESHTGAHQCWQGATGRLMFRAGETDCPSLVTVRPDGSAKREFPTRGFQPWTCTPDGRTVFGNTPLDAMFPGDGIAPRDDKGLLAMDLETGLTRVTLSIEDALAVVPNANEIAACHLFVKTVLVHRRLPRVLFTLTNTFWDRDRCEPRVRILVTVGTDGSAPAYLGNCLHHPNWHTLENRVLSNVLDFNGQARLGLYPGAGGLLEYIPTARGSGHPSFSPDGRWICTDGGGPRGNRVVLCDPRTGRMISALEVDAVHVGYPSFKAVDERAAGETVVTALARAGKRNAETWQTQCHPAWSRDGSAILFNSDFGGVAQLYAIDVARTLAENRLPGKEQPA